MPKFPKPSWSSAYSEIVPFNSQRVSDRAGYVIFLDKPDVKITDETITYLDGKRQGDDLIITTRTFPRDYIKKVRKHLEGRYVWVTWDEEPRLAYATSVRDDGYVLARGVEGMMFHYPFYKVARAFAAEVREFVVTYRKKVVGGVAKWTDDHHRPDRGVIFDVNVHLHPGGPQIVLYIEDEHGPSQTRKFWHEIYGINLKEPDMTDTTTASPPFEQEVNQDPFFGAGVAEGGFILTPYLTVDPTILSQAELGDLITLRAYDARDADPDAHLLIVKDPNGNICVVTSRPRLAEFEPENEGVDTRSLGEILAQGLAEIAAEAEQPTEADDNEISPLDLESLFAHLRQQRPQTPNGVVNNKDALRKARDEAAAAPQSQTIDFGLSGVPIRIVNEIARAWFPYNLLASLDLLLKTKGRDPNDTMELFVPGLPRDVFLVTADLLLASDVVEG